MTKKVDKHYVTGIPRNPLPEGRVLVHNPVIPQRHLGTNGFRAWTQTLDDTLVKCPCHWAGVDLHGLVHYRVRLSLPDHVQNAAPSFIETFILEHEAIWEAHRKGHDFDDGLDAALQEHAARQTK